MLLSADVAELDPDHVFQLDVPATTLFELLREELAIRADLAAFYDAVGPDHAAARQEAHDRLQAVEQDVRERLVSIGYVDPGHRLTGAEGEFTPDFLHRHPEVRAAREHRRSLATNHTATDAQVNADAVAQVRAELDRLRREAVKA